MKPGDLVVVYFEDHAAIHGGTADPIPCRAVGWFLKETKKAIVIVPWISDSELEGNNSDSFVIVKHPGVKVEVVQKDKARKR